MPARKIDERSNLRMRMSILKIRSHSWSKLKKNKLLLLQRLLKSLSRKASCSSIYAKNSQSVKRHRKMRSKKSERNSPNN